MMKALVLTCVLVSFGATASAQSGNAVPLASLSTQPSMNVFRRFAGDPAKMAGFYSDVLGLRQLPSLNMPGGGRMMLFEIGTGQVKLQAYREFVGLKPLPPVEDTFVGATRYPFRHGTTTVNLWTFGKGLPANTRSAGIQYVVADVEAVDARAKAHGVKIDTPLGNFGAGLRTIWLSDHDGITNYFAQIVRGGQSTTRRQN